MQPVLHLADLAHEMIQRFCGIGDREQIGQPVMRAAAPAQVIGNAGRLIARAQGSKPVQFVAVHAVGRSKRQADTVKAQGINFGDGGEPAMRRTAITEVVLRMHFNPCRVSGGLVPVQRIGIMRRFQTDADSGGKTVARFERTGLAAVRRPGGMGESVHRARLAYLLFSRDRFCNASMCCHPFP